MTKSFPSVVAFKISSKEEEKSALTNEKKPIQTPLYVLCSAIKNAMIRRAEHLASYAAESSYYNKNLENGTF